MILTLEPGTSDILCLRVVEATIPAEKENFKFTKRKIHKIVSGHTVPWVFIYELTIENPTKSFILSR